MQNKCLVVCVGKSLNCNYLLLVLHKASNCLGCSVNRWARLTHHSETIMYVCVSAIMCTNAHIKWISGMPWAKTTLYLFCQKQNDSSAAIVQTSFFLFWEGLLEANLYLIFVSCKKQPKCLITLPQKQQTCIRTTHWSSTSVRQSAGQSHCSYKSH